MRNPTADIHESKHPGDKLLIAALLLTLAVLLGGVAVPSGILVWETTQPMTVINEGPAGTFDHATSSPGGFFTNTLTSVQTSLGSITVDGTFSALKGSHLVVRGYNKRDRLRLCTANGSVVCAPLEGAWAGPMAPTPDARRTFAFARHGLSPENLGRWLGLGILGSLAAILAAAGIGLHADDEEDRT